jgi:hypothetical protein
MKNRLNLASALMLYAAPLMAAARAFSGGRRVYVPPPANRYAVENLAAARAKRARRALKLAAAS